MSLNDRFIKEFREKLAKEMNVINQTDIDAMKLDVITGGSKEKGGRNLESAVLMRPPKPTPTKPKKSNGGPSSYYDFEDGWTTWNDFMEYKASNQWGPYSVHFKDIGKAICRFGVKEGTNDAYDARKIIYSGLRLLGMIEGKEAMRAELLSLLDDPQFTL